MPLDVNREASPKRMESGVRGESELKNFVLQIVDIYRVLGVVKHILVTIGPNVADCKGEENFPFG